MDKNRNIDKTDSMEIELQNKRSVDILGDPPNWLIHTGSYMVYSIFFLFLMASIFISYPEVVGGAIAIEDIANVNWITSNSNGKIETFLVKNDSLLNKGDTIGVFQNPAKLRDVIRFCQVLSNVEQYYLTNNTDLLRRFPFDLVMGEITDSYEKFTLAVRNCIVYDDYNYYSQRISFLKRELKVLNRNPNDNELPILKIEREIFEMYISHKIEMEKNRKELELAYEDIVNSLKSWEDEYLIKSTYSGRIVLGDIKSLKTLISVGDTICSVISNNEPDITGKIYLNQENIAPVKMGDKVNVKLSKYPSQSFGVLIGEISSVSYLPHNKMYVVDVKFPNNLKTSAGREINYEVGLKGQAEIITSDQNMLSRIFMPIYN